MKSEDKSTYILGVYYGHNATACLLKNWEVIAAASEERFNNIKNYSGFPKKAINYVLSEAGIKSSDLDLVTLSHKYGTPIHSVSKVKEGFLLKLFVLISGPIGTLRKIWGDIVFRFTILRPIGRFFYLFTIYTIGSITNKNEMDFLANYLGIDRDKVKAYDHHLSHAASSYYSSPLSSKKILALTLDGEGDSYCASVNIFEKNKIQVLSRTSRDNSLGLMYAYLTEHLGMKSNEHEYKVMGLAAYAKSEDIQKVYERIKDLVKVDRNKLTFETKFNTIDIEKFLHKNLHDVRFDLLAASFQKLLEDRVVEWVEASIKKTDINFLVLSGGVFMNVKLNKKIAELKDVKELFIIPSAGDESSIIGSSYLGHLDINPDYFPKSIQNIYWGPDFTTKDIETTFRNSFVRKRYKVKKVEKIEKVIARLLSEGKIVARVSGRMEFGARALGNRSILADPRNIDVIPIINEQIKNRDFWMPFAPSIIEERAKDYIVNPKNLESHYMMLSFNTTPFGRKELKAAMHQSDFTVRPQIVIKNFNPKYHKLIKEFEKLTGIGAVLNTSFNLHGFPIVLGPKEALFVFENSGLEYLAIENYLISKKR